MSLDRCLFPRQPKADEEITGQSHVATAGTTEPSLTMYESLLPVSKYSPDCSPGSKSEERVKFPEHNQHQVNHCLLLFHQHSLSLAAQGLAWPWNEHLPPALRAPEATYWW